MASLMLRNLPDQFVAQLRAYARDLSALHRRRFTVSEAFCNLFQHTILAEQTMTQTSGVFPALTTRGPRKPKGKGGKKGC